MACPHCGAATVQKGFCQGHDQSYRIDTERLAGNILQNRQHVDAARNYAKGEATLEQFSQLVRQQFV